MRCAGLITLSKRLPKHMDSKLLADSWAAIELNIEKLGPLLKQIAEGGQTDLAAHVAEVQQGLCNGRPSCCSLLIECMAQPIQRPPPASLVTLNGQLVLAGSSISPAGPAHLAGVPSGGRLVEDAAGHLVWQPASSAAQPPFSVPTQAGHPRPGHPQQTSGVIILHPPSPAAVPWRATDHKAAAAAAVAQAAKHGPLPGKQVQVPAPVMLAQPLFLSSPGQGAPSIVVMPQYIWPALLPDGRASAAAAMPPAVLSMPLSQPIPHPCAAPRPAPTSAASLQPGSNPRHGGASSTAQPSHSDAPGCTQPAAASPAAPSKQPKPSDAPSGPAATSVPPPRVPEGLAVLADAALASEPDASSSDATGELRPAQHKDPPSAPCRSADQRIAARHTSLLRRTDRPLDLSCAPDRPTAFSAWAPQRQCAAPQQAAVGVLPEPEPTPRRGSVCADGNSAVIRPKARPATSGAELSAKLASQAMRSGCDAAEQPSWPTPAGLQKRRKVQASA